MKYHHLNRERGVALVLVAVLSLALITLSVMSLDMTITQTEARRGQEDTFAAKQIAESAASQALARIKEGGQLAPLSGGGVTPQWVSFSGGAFYYYSIYDTTTDVSTIRAWGRVAVSDTPSSSTAAPDSVSWDSTGWLTRGVEISIKSSTYIPDTPMFFGNGGIQKPMGGFAWTSGADVTDSSTWGTVTSSPDSEQDSSVPVVLSALDHPYDYIYNGGSPTPASSNPHPFNIWTSQNAIGQFNVEAWMANSAGSSSDPTVGVTPPPTSSYYDTSDNTSADYPYPVNPGIPDVQTFADALWSGFKDDPGAVLLSEGSHNGTYGDLTTPGVTFVTGKLTVDSADTFRGAGILIIRDDYDPNVDTDNVPSTHADLEISGTFEWTGLVIVAGWTPWVIVNSGANATIVGAMFGEDSVQSGGELSLDSATIGVQVNGPFRVLFSEALFQSGGLVRPYMPLVNKQVIGIREIPYGEINTTI